MMEGSAFFGGVVMHARFRPRRHKLSYKVFNLLLDLDELPALDKRLKFFSYNRPGLMSFHEKDHGYGTADGLRQWVTDQLTAAGLTLAQPRVKLLCYPRILGYVFNPISVYFCYDGARLASILYEVCNTFHERRTYVITAGDGPGPHEHECDKELYVSPFVPMECRYHFHITEPSEDVLIRIDETDREGRLLLASFAAKRQEMTDAVLGKALLAYPLMTLKVIAAIHWEAVKLWLKRVPIFWHTPSAEKVTTSVVEPQKKN